MDDFTDIDDITRVAQPSEAQQSTAIAPSNQTQQRVADDAHNRFMEDKLRRIEANPNSVSATERNAAFSWRDRRNANAAMNEAKAVADAEKERVADLEDRKMKVAEGELAARVSQNEFQRMVDEREKARKDEQDKRLAEEHEMNMRLMQSKIDAAAAADRREAEEAERRNAERTDGLYLLAKAATGAGRNKDGMITGKNFVAIANEVTGRDDIIGMGILKDPNGDGDESDAAVAFYRMGENGAELIEDEGMFFSLDEFQNAYNAVPGNAVPEKVAVANANADARRDVAQIGADARAGASDAAARNAQLQQLIKLYDSIKDDADDRPAKEVWAQIQALLGGGAAPSAGGAASSGNTVTGASGRQWTSR